MNAFKKGQLYRYHLFPVKISSMQLTAGRLW